MKEGDATRNPSPPGSAGRGIQEPLAAAYGGSRIIKRPAITPRNEAAFTTKHQPSPMTATSTPATAGPRMRPLLKTLEFSAMAFIRSSLPTISTRKDCRPVMSKTPTIPRPKAR